MSFVPGFEREPGFWRRQWNWTRLQNWPDAVRPIASPRPGGFLARSSLANLGIFPEEVSVPGCPRHRPWKSSVVVAVVTSVGQVSVTERGEGSCRRGQGTSLG